jgi:hypothetical protein
MIETPPEKVVLPHGIGSLAAIAVVKLLDLPLGPLIDFDSVLLKHGLRRVLDILKT